MKSKIKNERNLIFGNLEKLAKNRQVGLICHTNTKRNQETGNTQTKQQTEYCKLPLMRMRVKHYITGLQFLMSAIADISNGYLCCLEVAVKF